MNKQIRNLLVSDLDDNRLFFEICKIVGERKKFISLRRRFKNGERRRRRYSFIRNLLRILGPDDIKKLINKILDLVEKNKELKSLDINTQLLLGLYYTQKSLYIKKYIWAIEKRFDLKISNGSIIIYRKKSGEIFTTIENQG